MRILMGHNHYQFLGGEDAVVKAESDLLKDKGNDVFLYEKSNSEMDEYSALKKLHYLFSLSFSKTIYKELRGIIKEVKPDVVHFHNIYYVMTPAVYYACKDENVPVVQSQHNFRISCPNALFYRENNVCEECLEKSLWQSVIHGCYKNSRFLTAVVALMIKKHRKLGTWQNKVDRFIVASEFGKNKFIQAGIPESKIFIKPNFVHLDPGARNGSKKHVLYVGRLSEEKGVDVLLKAWEDIKGVTLKIAGDGPLSSQLKDYVKKNKIDNVEFLGFVDSKTYDEAMRNAKFIIIPSRCYENFPRIIAEAFAYGIPVIASRLGSLKEIVEDGKNGLLFEAGSVSDLSEKINWMINNPNDINSMGEYARKVYENKYSAEKNYEILINVYKDALQSS